MEHKNIKFGNILEVGGYSKVYHCIFNGKEVISKVVNKSCKHTFINEINNLEKINHEYVIKPLQVIHEDMIFITEYKGDNLFNLLTENYLSKCEKIKIVFQLLDAVMHIHSSSICHLDLKLENVVYNGEYITVIDFGLSHFYSDKNYKVLKNRCGSKNYIAPEVYNGEIYNGFVSDMWSLGVLIFSLFFNCFPYFSPCLSDSGFSCLINKNVESLCKFYGIVIDYNKVPYFVFKLMNKLLVTKKKRYNILQAKYLTTYYSDTKKRHVCLIV